MRAPLEFYREWLLVKENPRVVAVAVEPVLHLAHGVYRAVDVRVARKHDERRIRTVAQRGSQRGCAGIYYVMICRWDYIHVG